MITTEGLTKRYGKLTIVEDLVLGPVDHKPPFDDPRFEKLEPNSGIRLSYVTKASPLALVV